MTISDLTRRRESEWGNRMETFDILPQSEVLLYGAGQLGRQIFDRLITFCQIRAFLDRAPERASAECKAPVYSPFGNKSIDRGTPVIICLHSTLEQTKAAKKLYGEGFSRLLFYPEGTTAPEAAVLRRAYCLLMEGAYAELRGLPCYGELETRKLKPYVLRHSGSFVTTLASPDVLYIGGNKQPDQLKKVASSDCTEEYREASARFDRYTNRPLPMFGLYLEFFRALLDGREAPKEYLNVCRHVQNCAGMDDDLFFRERFEVFRLLEQKLEMGLESFYDSPVDVDWNEKGYLETVDGNHRAAYLYCKGYRWIPVRMKTEDFERWKSETDVRALVRLLEQYDPQTLRTPLCNPYFLTRQTGDSAALQRVMCRLMEFLAKQDLCRANFLDWSWDNGYFASCFYQMGAGASAVAEDHEPLRELTVALNRVRHTQAVPILSGEEALNGQYDLAFVSTADGMETEEIAASLRDRVQSLMVCIFPKSETFADRVKQLTGMPFYRRLDACYFDGMPHETGVFSRFPNFRLNGGEEGTL